MCIITNIDYYYYIIHHRTYINRSATTMYFVGNTMTFLGVSNVTKAISAPLNAVCPTKRLHQDL